ncbi:MAG: serine/threonine-protein kinase [Kofleriaceae bacterium]
MKILPSGTCFAGRYEILGLLGQGGMGVVYRARHIELDKEVALKILAELVGDREVRFEREARTTAKLDHPNCVRILDYGRAGTNPFIAMELVEGTTVGRMLGDQGPLPLARAVQLTRSILTGLAHAHERDVLHRDIKPENIMVRSNGRCVLIDFGLARLRDDSPLTAAGTCLGSPSYLAPERLLQRGCDARSDLYAVGVVLYEMLTNAKPFVGSRPIEVLEHALVRPPKPIRALRPEVPRALEAVIVRALAKDPDRRFGDAREMMAALDDLELLASNAEQRRHNTRAEELPTTSLEILTLAPRSWLRRWWSQLRYGRWRWA